MINVSLQMTRRLVGIEVIVWEDGLSHHLETVQLVVHVEPAPVVLGQLAGFVVEPDRCAVDAAEILGLDLDVAVLYELIPSVIKLWAGRTAKDIVFEDFVAKEYGLWAKGSAGRGWFQRHRISMVYGWVLNGTAVITIS